ncbi:MAG: AraC family transcriptional regulator [Spirochaetes bacterium]|nr:AraC family transcriptional regulator [Spirochaetota bacterium]
MAQIKRIPQTFLALVEESLSADLIDPGENKRFVDGLTHRKVLPWTVIAQAYDGRYGIQPDGRTMTRTEEGGAFIVGANTWMTIVHHAAAKGGIMKGRWVHIHFSVFGSFDYLSFFDLPLTVNASIGTAAGAIIIEMLSDPYTDTASPFPRIARKKARAFRLLDLITQAAPFRSERAGFLRHARHLGPALAFVKTKMGTHFEAKDIADAAGLSVSHLHALFKKHLGVTPMDHVRDVRLSEARYRIVAERDTLADIAQRTGFSDQFHLSRAFKEKYGISPSDFRRQHDASM